MDAHIDINPHIDFANDDISFELSYDEGTTYEEQVAALPPMSAPSLGIESKGGGELVGRIGTNKVYLPPESLSRGKRKRSELEDGDVGEEEKDMSIDDGTELRPNALYLCGPPISQLPTDRIFTYAKHFHAEPEGLEWIDDTSCVLVFASNAACRNAIIALRKSSTASTATTMEYTALSEKFDNCVAARAIPATLWPATARLSKELGAGAGAGAAKALSGPLYMRVAMNSDRKVPGAKKRSMYYRTHGITSDSPASNSNGVASLERKRPRIGEPGTIAVVGDEEETRRQLDAELDEFLREGEDDAAEMVPPPPYAGDIEQSLGVLPEPRSKMRSDYIMDGAGRSLLERTSFMRAHPDDLEFEQPEKGREQERAQWDEKRQRRRDGGRRSAGGRKGDNRHTKTAQELDDELDAFLNSKD